MSANRKTKKRVDDDSTTDEDVETTQGGVIREKYVSAKLTGEKWVNKKLGNQLKAWLRANVSLRNRSYAGEYITKFLEVAQLASKFTDERDQDRAFDEVMSVFVEWPKLTISRQFVEFSNQNVLQILTELGIPFWFSRILHFLSRTENTLQPNQEFKTLRKELIEHKDSMENTFSHYLIKLMNANPSMGIYAFSQALHDPIWFGNVKQDFIGSFTQIENKSKQTAFDLLDNATLKFTIVKAMESSNLIASNVKNPYAEKRSSAETAQASTSLKLAQRQK